VSPAPAPGAPARRGKRGRLVRLTSGWALTVAGLILGPVPVLPGVVFLVPGVAILAAESRWIRALLRRYRERRLLRQAFREAERVGIKINLDHDPEVDGADPSAPPGPGTGTEG
jgi:putative transmembrane protein PGPGW